MRKSRLSIPTTVAISVLFLFSLKISAGAQPVVDPTDLDMDGIPGVTQFPEKPSQEVPSVLAGTGVLLIDRSHGSDFDVSGFTDFLAANGWTIAVLAGGPIDDDALSGVDVLLIPAKSGSSLFPFSAAETSAIQSFLAAGGGLWALNDNNNPSGINTLASTFGVAFQYDYVRDPTNNEGELIWPTIHLLEPHPVTVGVDTYGYYLGDCLLVTTPAEIVARADEDAYSLFCPVGSMPPTIAVWAVGAGRAVFAGDETPLHPAWYTDRLRAEEQILLQNIANWLLGDATTSTAPSSWGKLKHEFGAKE